MSRETFASATDVSRETLERFDTYAALLAKWNPAINLVAKPTLNDIWVRHFLDSAQLLDHVDSSAKTWIDLGSGAGLPGLVIAILRPDISVTLVESDRRKSVFLTEAARECGVAATVMPSRVEAIDIKADIISARALAPLTKLLELSESLLAENGKALFLKGEQAENELTEANHLWHTSARLHESRADPRGRIVEITDFHRRTGL